MHTKTLDSFDKTLVYSCLLRNIQDSICISETSKLIEWLKWFFLIIALSSGLIPTPSYAQLSQETLNLLSEQDKVAQEQLSKEDKGIGTTSINGSSLLSTNNLTDQKYIDSPTDTVDNGSIILEPQAVTTTYSASPQVGPGQCTSFYDNYGCYALQLKGYNPFTSSVSPFRSPSASDLNAQEANPLYFPSGDPPGTWLETQRPTSFSGQQYKNSFNEFAIGAAKAMSDWKTPVFFQIDSSGATNAVLESISFSSNYNIPNVLSNLCSSNGFNTRGANVATVASGCAFSTGINSINPGVTVSSIEIAYWPQFGNGFPNRIDRTYSGSSLDSFILNNFNGANSRTYVWDPPEAAQTVLGTVESVPEPSSELGLLAFGLFTTASFIKHKRK